MPRRKLFTRNMNCDNTTHDLYNDYAGYSVAKFNSIELKKSPDTIVQVCIYQWRDGLEKLLDKQHLGAFLKKYVEQGTVLHFDPMSRVFIKLEFTEATDFEFELMCELDVREHEPVYL
mgnify:CR=1 FL=1